MQNELVRKVRASPVCRHVRLSVCQPISMPVSPPVRMSTCQSVSLSPLTGSGGADEEGRLFVFDEQFEEKLLFDGFRSDHDQCVEFRVFGNL